MLTQGSKEVNRTGPTRSEGAQLGAASELDRTLWDEDLTFAFGSGGTGVAALTPLKIVRSNAPLNFLVPAWYLRAGRMKRPCA